MATEQMDFLSRLGQAAGRRNQVMNCEKFNELRVDIAQGKPLPSEQRSKALTHIENCPVCEALLQGEEKLGQVLENLRRHSNLINPPQANEAILLEFFRKQQTRCQQGVPAIPGVQKAPRQSTHWLTGIAAIILLGVVLLYFKTGLAPEQSLNPSLTATSALPQPQKSTPAAPASLAPQPPEAQTNLRTLAASAPQRRTNRKTSSPLKRASTQNIASSSAGVQRARNTDEQVTEFIEVTPMVEIYPQEVQQIVRVRMPRGNLARYGFPVNPERISEPVQTDLLLTQDGLVKAVRFVK
jgi:hypothetical protein